MENFVARHAHRIPKNLSYSISENGESHMIVYNITVEDEANTWGN